MGKAKELSELGGVVTVDNGNAQLSGNLSVGGATPTTSGTGITFPATQSASSNANTLDDYEEGTFTPSIVYGGLTATVNNSAYTKIGRLVVATFDVTWPATADSNIAGVYLPFAGAATYANAFIGYTDYGSIFTIENQFGASNFMFNTLSGAGITNASFSGKRVIATAVYFTS